MERDVAAGICLGDPRGLVRRHATEVEAVRKAHQVAGEAISSDVGALPRGLEAGKRPEERGAVASAALVVLPLGAHEEERALDGLTHTLEPRGNQRREIEIEQLRRIVDVEGTDPPLGGARVREETSARADEPLATLDQKYPNPKLASE
jgi:hypothetical protein